MKNIAISILLLLLLVVSPLCAAIPTQYDGSSWWNTDYNTTEGTDFWLTYMFNYGNTEHDNKDLHLAVYATARETTQVTVYYADQTRDTFQVEAFSRSDKCEIDISKAYIIEQNKILQKGIHVVSNKPIALYAVNENDKQGSQDAAIIYPTEALYKDYVIQTYQTDGVATEFAFVTTRMTRAIKIHIIETETSTNKVVLEKDTFLYDIPQGATFLYRSQGADYSLSGTSICSEEPIAVFNGGQHAEVPYQYTPNNHLYASAASVDKWGKRFVVASSKGQKVDYVRITAAENNTKIYKNGIFRAIIQSGETYQDTIYNPSYKQPYADVFETTRAAICYMYQTGYEVTDNAIEDDGEEGRLRNERYGAPALSPILPMEYGMHSVVFACLENLSIQKHFINIVCETSAVSSITLDNNNISSSFTPVPYNQNYSFAQIELDKTKKSHLITSAKGVFVANIYGFGINGSRRGSYAYSAGGKITHPAWMLINGVRTDRIEVCEDEMPVKFTSVINYDYTDVRWEHHYLQGHSRTIKTPTLTLSDGTKATGDSIIDRYYDDIPRGLPLVNHIDTVYMIVSRKTPICENIIIDTIKAIVQVNDTFQIDENYESNLNANVCYGEEFTVHHQGKDYKYKADTSTKQYYNGELIRLKLNEPYSFIDSLTTQFGCDSIINQIRILRPTYDIVVYDTICVNNLPYTTTLYDTQANLMGKNISVDIPKKEKDKLFGHQHKYIKPFIKDTAVQLTTIYGCDSIINLRLVVLPIYKIKEEPIKECKDTIYPYIWEKHTDKNGHPLGGHKIYRENENGELIRMGYNDMISLSPPGTYTYVDFLRTCGCKTCYDAPGCDSVYILTLIVKDQLKKQERKNLCDNKSFVWLDSLYLGVNFDQEMIPQPYKINKKWRVLTKNTHLEYRVPSTQEEVCDSLYTMDVTWCPTYKADMKKIHICENESYTYQPRYPKTHPHDKTYKWTCEVNTDGTKKVGIYNLVDTVETIVKCDGNKGCDSIVHHVVYVHPVYVDTLYETECQNYMSLYKWSEITEPLVWDKQQNKHISPKEIPLSSTGDFVYIDSTYTKTCIDCRNGYGCDSILVLCLHVNPICDKIESRSLCENDTLHWRGKVYIGGKASDKISVGSSKRFWANPKPQLGDAEDLYRMPHTYADINHKWKGNKYTDSVYFKTKDGCDSIYWLELTVYPSYEIHDTLHICDNERTSWQGATYAGSKYNGSAIHKYDASVEWHLDTMSLATNGYSCDSIRILHLMVHPTYDEIHTDTVCQDYPYEWIAHTNHYVYDSVAKKDIYIAKSIPTNEPGLHTYVDRLKTTTCADCNQGGCDSIWTLRLYVKPTLTSTVQLTICPEQLPFEYGENGKVATAEGTYNDTIRRDVNGVCDSIVTYVISVSDENRLVIPIVRCENEVPYSYDYGTTPSDNMRLTNLTKTGTYLDTIRQAGACNQIIELSLTVNDTTTTDTTYHLCIGDTYVDKDFSSIIATKDTSYVKRLERANSVGCDSVVYVTVKFGQTYEDPTQEQILCESDSAYVWEIRDTHGTYRQTLKWGNLHEQVLDTTLYDTLHTISPYNCDSVVSIHIVVKPTVYNEYFRTICPEQVPYNEFGNRDEYVTTSGTYSHYITGGSHRYGCDSIEILHLTISDSIVTHIEQIICNNELPYNHISAHATPELENLTKSGIYRQTLDAASGCDSTVVLHLTVNDTTTTDTTYHLCMGDTYVDEDFSSIIATKDTSYVKRLERANSVGCDSVVYVTVKFGQIYVVSNPGIKLCETDVSYTWQTQDTYGQYNHVLSWPALNELVLDTTLYDTLHTAYPFYCDSVTSVRIIVNPTTVREYDKEWCASTGPYSYGDHGKTASSTGTYIDTLAQKNHYGCDSIEILHLVVNDSVITYIDTTICSNELPFNHISPHSTPNLSNLTISGTYRETLQGVLCDSMIVLHLTINDTTTTDTTYHLCMGDTYVDEDFSSIIATKDTSYVKRLERANSVGCDSVVYVTVKFGQTYVVSDLDVKLCETDVSYTWQTQDTYGQYNHVLSWPALNELVLDTTLYDTLHTAYPFYCDSVTSVRIIVNPTTVREYDKEWCASAGPYSYGDHGKTASSTGIYIDTLAQKNHYGCDSVEILNFVWLDSIYYHDTIVICDNKVYEKHSKLYVGDKYASFGGVYDATLFDSVRVYTVGLHHDTITFLTPSGCDSTYYITIEVQPTHYSKQERDVCQYEDTQYEAMYNGLGGKVKTDVLGDVVFIDTVPAISNGCDSIIHMTYHIRPHYHFSQGEITLCQTMDSMWVWYNEEGDPQDTISLSEGNRTYTLGTQYETIYGCDSTYGITVYVAPTYHMYDTITLCENDSIHWQNVLFTGSQYTAYGKTYDIADFDSVKTSLEDGEYDFSVRYGTETYDCDSVYYLHLTINPVRHKTIEIRQCQTDEGRFYENLNNGVGGYLPANYLSDSLTRNDTIQTILGCDSIITLHYYVDSVYRYGVEYTFCQDTINNMQEWVDEEGVSHGYVLDISKPGDFRLSENHTTIFGCDSTYGVTWHVDPIYRYDTIIDMCENQRVEWQNTLYTGDSVINKTSEDTIVLAPGVYHEYRNYLTVAGCDSSYHAQINVHAVYDTLTQITVCESDGFVWRQNDHIGIYVDTIIPVAYCDTMRLLPYEATNPQTKRDTIMRYAERMLETIHGCDSLSRLIVTVKPTYFFLTDTTICSNDRVLYRGKYFSSKDTVYTEYLNTEDNCDSIYQLRLHVRPTFMNVRHVTMCDNETLYHPSQNRDDIVWRPGDEIRDSEWEYYDMIYTDTDGCDSIYRYYLLIHPSYLFVDTLTLCSADSILLHGGKYVGEKIEFPTEKYIEPYKAFYADTLLTIHGCDSIYGIYATIYPAYRHCDTITICDDESTTWRKHYYEGNMIGNKPGDGLADGHHVFRDSFKTIYGCDSIYELHLYVTPTHLFEEHITKCADDNLTWRMFNLNHVPVGNHFYYDSLQTIGYGCDSVYHLYLTVNDTTSEVIYDTICRTESYNLHGVHIYEPGYYYDTTLNEWGCHHFTHLYLEVIEPTVPIAWADSICADDNAYELFYTYTGRDPIAYSVLYDNEGHYYGFEDIIDEPIETEEQLSMLTIPMPLRDGDKTKYPKPNYYNIKLVLDNGICTNLDLCSTDTSVVLSYPSWITQQRFGDVIALYNEKYNGGYCWSHYQWYHGDTLLVGETHEYLYVPTGLVVGDQYHVRLTREGEVQDFQTCPITIVADPIVEDFAPTMGYLSVVPTCVCADNSVAYILSRKDGMYRVTYNGVLVKEGVFRADVTEVPLSNVEGIYMFQLWSPDTPEEPYRCIKVLVSKKCPNYDIPF